MYAPQTDCFYKPIANRSNDSFRLVAVMLDVNTGQIRDRFTKLMGILLEHETPLLGQRLCTKQAAAVSMPNSNGMFIRDISPISPARRRERSWMLYRHSRINEQILSMRLSPESERSDAMRGVNRR